MRHRIAIISENENQMERGGGGEQFMVYRHYTQ